MPKQHLPILKICSCPCQAGPKAWEDYEKARNITYQLEGGEANA